MQVPAGPGHDRRVVIPGAAPRRKGPIVHATPSFRERLAPASSTASPSASPCDRHQGPRHDDLHGQRPARGHHRRRQTGKSHIVIDTILNMKDPRRASTRIGQKNSTVAQIVKTLETMAR